ncbi:MAG: hypothetical protein KatS3mg102_2232 [Planctomycetota bacterium]|nr:MAG: hypothetical protein KatS3mg102_2232 [Planctomycetota bacterium]
MTMLSDRATGGLEQAIARALEELEAGAAPLASPEALRALAADLDRLGWFGVLVAASEAPPPSDELYEDIIDGIRRGLVAALGEAGPGPAPGAEPPPAPEPLAPSAQPRALAPLEELIERHLARPLLAGEPSPEQAASPDQGVGPRGRRAARTTRRAIAEALYEHFGLDEHGLFVEDVERVLDLFRSAGAGSSDTKAFIRGLSRLSSDAARFIVGLFPGHIQTVYELTRRTAERREVEAVFDEYAPPAIWKRLPAVLKALIQKDKRLRLAITLWARLHGVDIRPEHVHGVERYLEVKSSRALLERLLARAEQRAALLAFHDRRRAVFEALLRALERSGPVP